MANIVWADVVAVAAELSSVALAMQTTLLDYVNTSLAAAYFGGTDSSEYKLARMYLCAHEATVNSASGVVTSESAGGLSRSYAVVLGSGGYEETSYGRKFQAMLRRSSAKGGLLA